MIIIRLKGGLGNQLFQYALGRAIAERSGRELKLDVSSYASDALRAFRLQHLSIRAQLATPAEIEALNPPKAHYLRWCAVRIRQALSPRRRHSYIKERAFAFDPEVLDADGPVYLNGYWQSPRYFADVEATLAEEFRPHEALPAAAAELAEEMNRANAVSLHVRRGDYVSNPQALKLHGALALAYYERATTWVAERIDTPHFYVFSDAPDWVRAHLRIAGTTTFVAERCSNADFHDLTLMSRCRHHVLANSSFSWWGAWLNRSPDSLVVAPQRWFQAPIDTRDLLPPEWARL